MRVCLLCLPQSGGQCRRVSLAELLASQSRVLCLDEVSSGLDSATTLDIVGALREWAVLTGATVLMALLQPSPSVAAMFDRTLLLREGATVFHGPSELLPGYLRSINVHPSQEQELADFIVDWLAEPTKLRKVAAVDKRHPPATGADDVAPGMQWREEHSVSQVHFHDDAPPSPSLRAATVAAPCTLPELNLAATPSPLSPPPPPTTTAALREAFERSDIYKQQLQPPSCSSAAAASSPHPRTPYVHCQFYSRSSHSWLVHTWLLVGRQCRLLLRARAILLPRLLKDLGYGLVAGSLFWQTRGPDSYSSKVALAFVGSSALSFSNMSEVPLACQAKVVIQAQLDAAMYHPLRYVLAQALVHIPLSLLETLAFALPCYFLAGFAATSGGFLFFMLVLLLFNETMSALFKVVAYASGSPDVGQVLVEPTVTLLQAASGFLITRNYIPDFAIWIVSGLRNNDHAMHTALLRVVGWICVC